MKIDTSLDEYGKLAESNFEFEKFGYGHVFSRLIRKVDSFMDLNAEFGLFSILAASENRMCRIHAFESDPEKFQGLKKNVSENRLLHAVHFESLQFHGQTGEIDVPIQMGSEYSSLRGSDDEPTDLKTKSSYSNKTSIDEYCGQRMIDHVDMIRMGSPKSGRVILQGAHQLLLDVKPLMLVEMGCLEDMLQLKDIFRFYGYKTFVHVKKGLLSCEVDHELNLHKTGLVVFAHPSKLHLLSGLMIRSNSQESRSDLQLERVNGLLIRNGVASN